MKRALAGRADVRVALLFGSAARDALKPRSDVDLAVDAPGVDLLALGATLSAALAREVDVVRLDGAGYVLVTEIVRDGIVVHEGWPGAGAQWRSRTLATLETDRPLFERMSTAWLRRVAERGLPW